MRKVDIAHSGQTVPEALEQLKSEVDNARRARETALLVVHGFGASGAGGAIKAALETALPALAARYGFKAYGYADRERARKQVDVDVRSLNPGSTLLVFPEAKRDRESKADFRPNFRNLRSRVRVRVPARASAERCQHAKRQLVSRGPTRETYLCRLCGKTFVVPNRGWR